MEEEKHRMLYQGMDPSQAPVEPAPRPISQSPSEPPTYDDAMATEPPLAIHMGFSADRRRTFFAEPQHLRYRLEEMPYLVSEQPHLQVVPELPEEAELQEEPEMLELPLENPSPERREQRILEHSAPVRSFFELNPQPKLGSRALEIMCPACGQQGVTSVRRTAHTRTHVSALLLCTFGWCCCACLWPYLLKGCRITRHYCSVCEIFLGAHYPRGCCG